MIPAFDANSRGRRSEALQARQRLLIALGIGTMAALSTFLLLKQGGPEIQASDFTYPWLASRVMAKGENPYIVLRTADLPWERVFFYPLPAAILSLTVAWLPVQIAGSLFVGFGMGWLAYLATRDGSWRLLLFLSGPALQSCRSVQWTPLLTAATLFPPALGILVAKPNLALPLLAFQTKRAWFWWTVIGGGCLLLTSFAIQPTWVRHWLDTFRAFPNAGRYQSPILHPLGVVMALSITRWRRPEGRLLFCMACVPQNGLFYDQFPLMLIPQSRRELLIAAGASQIALLGASQFPWIGVAPKIVNQHTFPYIIIGLYLPALVMLLRRPNVGGLPPRLEKSAQRLPAWIRGTPSHDRPLAN